MKSLKEFLDPENPQRETLLEDNGIWETHDIQISS